MNSSNLRGTRGVLCAIVVCTAVCTATAQAQERYAGAWKIASSEPAPWPHAADQEDAKEIRQLAGAAVAIKADRIDGPKQLVCKHPHYVFRKDGAEMLFQGALEEYGDKKTTPDAVATKLGFKSRPITTIEAGCGNEIEFHAIDDNHLLFGLNNRVYRMQRSGASAKPANAAKKKQP
jgi:hypothetical protein